MGLYRSEWRMFADALQMVGAYTRPLVASVRRANGDVECSISAYIVLNAEGWVLTTAHVMEFLRAMEEDASITNVSYWWGVDGLGMTEARVDPERDLALARLTGFDPADVAVYPVFGQPAGSRSTASTRATR
jgi:hypothetical protein